MTFLFSKIRGFADIRKDPTAAFPARLEGQRALVWSVGKCGLATILQQRQKKPDSFEPGGSGRLPKQPFQPLACALFSSWAFPL